MPSAAPRSAPDPRPLAERWRPRRLADIIGNARAVRDLRSWATEWQAAGKGAPRLRAALLEGPPGVGKTSAALALAHDFGWSVVEMNASDARNQDAIQHVAGRASVTNTLGEGGEYRPARDGARTLILLDEADCLTGRATEESSARPSAVTVREFLRGRYGSVESLNKAWGLGGPGTPTPFPTWESVPTTGGRGAWTRLAAAQRDLAEWRGAGRPSDTSDRGGLGAIARLVRSTRQPLLLTVNDPQPLVRYSPLFRSSVKRVAFVPIPPADLRGALVRVLAAEQIVLPPALLDRVIQRSRGDLRAALTDLEAVSVVPNIASASALLGARDIAADFYAFTREVLTQPRFYRSVEVRERLDATPDDLFPWIEENLPRAAPDARARYAGFEAAGRAELLLARARRYRVFGLWSFASEIMTGGVSAALAGSGPARNPDLSFPQFLGDMGRSRGQRALRTGVAQKAGRGLHHSRRKAIEASLPFLDTLFNAPGGPDPESLLRLQRAVARELELTKEDVAYLLGTEPDSEEAQRLAETPEPPEPVEVPETEPAPVPPIPEPGRPKKVQRKLAEF
jgi:replication factor C large subunit